jgi:predicted cation transporter
MNNPEKLYKVWHVVYKIVVSNIFQTTLQLKIVHDGEKNIVHVYDYPIQINYNSAFDKFIFICLRTMFGSSLLPVVCRIDRVIIYMYNVFLSIMNNFQLQCCLENIADNNFVHNMPNFVFRKKITCNILMVYNICLR